MQKKGIVIIALGYPLYGNCAFNLALSIKKNSPDIPIAIVYEDQSICQLSPKELSYFDHFIELDPSFYTVQGAKQEKQYQRAKLCVNLISNHPDLKWDQTIYMDADNFWFDKPIDELFEDLKNRDFFIGYNGQYNVLTKKKTNKNYTYWSAQGEKNVCNYHGIESILPQTISGFFYFKNGEKADSIFQKARDVYDDPKSPCITWAGGKPDEYCMNVSLGLHDYTQEEAHIFYFENVNGGMKEEIIRRKFLGFATGGNQLTPKLIHLYNKGINNLCLTKGIETRHYHVDKKDVIDERKNF
jgi:hypothetical protein